MIDPRHFIHCGNGEYMAWLDTGEPHCCTNKVYDGKTHRKNVFSAVERKREELARRVQSCDEWLAAAKEQKWVERGTK